MGEKWKRIKEKAGKGMIYLRPERSILRTFIMWYWQYLILSSLSLPSSMKSCSRGAPTGKLTISVLSWCSILYLLIRYWLYRIQSHDATPHFNYDLMDYHASLIYITHPMILVALISSLFVLNPLVLLLVTIHQLGLTLLFYTIHCLSWPE